MVGAHFPDATFIPVHGMWKRQLESSTIIEIITDEKTADRIHVLASELRHVFNQKAVLGTRTEVRVTHYLRPALIPADVTA